ncbi:MAG: cytochrome c oxidase subunit II [Verrucomicrobia bacterium]|nr:cytochrome c oxidase subunit II [Verrucomicrobiota bacterium]
MIIAGFNQAIGMAEVASEHGDMVDHFLEMVHWVMGVLFIGWSAFLVFVLLRFNKKANPKARYAGMTSHFSTHVEIGVVIVEVVLLLGFAFPLWAARTEGIPKGDNVLKIRAVGQQFYWTFHYAGKDGKMGLTEMSGVSAANGIGLVKQDPNAQDDFISLSELVLPLGQPVIVQVTSKDVIHGLAPIPLMTQQDAIPGREIPMWFTATKTGEWDIVCAQLCGAGHANMVATVKVMPKAEFDEWLAEQAPMFPPAAK